MYTHNECARSRHQAVRVAGDFIAPTASDSRRNTMEKKHSYDSPVRYGRWRALCSAALSLLLALGLATSAFAQNVAVTGTVTSTGGTPLPGVTVRVQGTDVRTI